MKLFVCVIGCLFISNLTRAQLAKVEFIEPQRFNSFFYGISGLDMDGYFYMESLAAGMRLIKSSWGPKTEVYNKKTGLLMQRINVRKKDWYKDFKLEQSKLRVLGGKPYILARDKRGRKKSLYAIEVNSLLNQVGEPINLGVLARSPLEPTAVEYYTSDNSKNLVLIQTSNKRKEPKEFKANIFSQNNSFISFNIKISERKVEQIQVQLVNDLVFIEFQKSASPFKNEPRRLFVANQYGNVKEIKIDSIISQFKLGTSRVLSKGNQILICGTQVNENGVIGYFTANLNPQNFKVSNVKLIDLNPDFITKFWDLRREKKVDSDKKNRRDENNELPLNLVATDMIETQDSGAILILQQRIASISTSNISTVHSSQISNSSMICTYKDAIVIKLDKYGNEEWKRIIPTYLKYSTTDPKKGYQLIVSKNNLFLLHGSSQTFDNFIGENSKIKKSEKINKNMFVTLTKISEKGEIKNQKIVKTKNDILKFNYNPNNIIVDDANNVFIHVSKNIKYFSKETCQVVFVRINDSQ